MPFKMRKLRIEKAKIGLIASKVNIIVTVKDIRFVCDIAYLSGASKGKIVTVEN